LSIDDDVDISVFFGIFNVTSGGLTFSLDDLQKKYIHKKN
jgi:predicted HicB family RNase H-like nuclease